VIIVKVKEEYFVKIVWVSVVKEVKFATGVVVLEK